MKTTYHLLRDGETAKRSSTVDGKTVTMNMVTRRNAESPRYAHTWVLDFTGVTENELLLLAARTVAIAYQRIWRELPSDKQRMEWVPPLVREWLDTERIRGGGFTSIKKQLDECKTEKEKIQKLKELGIL